MLSHITEHIADFIAPHLAERRNNLERIANTDYLTGLANRTAFENAARGAAEKNLSFVVFDLNNFGKVNKVLGFTSGDALLKYYAGVIRSVAANFKARAFRLGGDEFVIICSPRFATAVRDQVERRAAVRRFISFTVSISGESGSSLEGADSRLQARKAICKKMNDF